MKEVTESEGQIVMFIDEIHTVVGAGATSGSMDASNLLKPMLARGELRCIGATTLNEYKQVWLGLPQLSVTERDCDAREKRRSLLRFGPDLETKAGYDPIGVSGAIKATFNTAPAHMLKRLSYIALMFA